MKGFIALVLAFSAVSCLRSGPYLPSGWKPKGPAFLLPSEVEKTPEDILNNSKLGSEASGSDFLREYGPPVNQDLVQSVTVQALPDLFTERAFSAEQKVEVDVITEAVIDNGVAQLRSGDSKMIEAEIELVSVTGDKFEATNDATQKQEEISISEDVVTGDPEENEVTTEGNLILATQSESERDSVKSSVADLIDEVTEKLVQTEESASETKETEDVPLHVNIPEQLNIDVKAAESNVAADNTRLEEEGSGALMETIDANVDRVGFTEYGPPRIDEKSEKITESNELRRRRYALRLAQNTK